jgi:predicted nucleic acid-binding protein
MERTGIEYLYSFDDDFEGIEGISRLETAENPFK